MIIGSFGLLYIFHRMKQRNVTSVREKQTFMDFLAGQIDHVDVEYPSYTISVGSNEAMTHLNVWWTNQWQLRSSKLQKIDRRFLMIQINLLVKKNSCFNSIQQGRLKFELGVNHCIELGVSHTALTAPSLKCVVHKD